MPSTPCLLSRSGRWRRFVIVSAIVVGGWFLSAGAFAAESIYLKVICDGTVITDGDSQVDGLTDHAEIASVHHDLATPISSSSSGPVAGKFEWLSLRVVKQITASSVGFIDVMSRGVVCEEVRLRHYTQGEQGQEFWSMLLENALISERTHWTMGGEMLPQESLSFVPTKITWTFYPTAPAPPVSYTWEFGTSTTQ